jgi:hypothetical protein
MARKTNKLMRWIWGTSDAKQIGFDQTLKGLREGRRDDLYKGLAISAFAYLQKSKPRKTLIHKETIPEGRAIVIHNVKSGEPRLEIVRPQKNQRG